MDPQRSDQSVINSEYHRGENPMCQLHFLPCVLRLIEQSGKQLKLLLLSLLFALQCGPGAAQDYRFVKGGGGLPIAVAQWGFENAPAVLLLHGAGFSKEYWIAQRNPDAERCAHFVAMDLRGHGASGKPWEPNQIIDSTLWAADVNAVMKDLDIKDVLLVGWSYGGYVAMDYIRHYGTENLAGLLIVGSTAGFVDRPQISGEAPLGYSKALERRSSLNLDENAEGADYLAGLMSSTTVSEITRRSWVRQMMALPVYLKTIMSSRSLDNSDQLDRLDIPVTFLLGSEDLSVSREAVSQLVDIKMNSANLLISEGSGHAVSHDDQEGFFETLEQMVLGDANPTEGGCTGGRVSR